MAYTLIGRDFVPPDVRGKVTGQAKYAEDFRAEGMLFCKLLTSPMPHARVRSIDASAALALEGVHAVLTADDIPAAQAPRSPATPILTNEPCYVGEPILAVAAVDETTAQDAIDLIELDLEPLPFTFDPLESLYPGGPNARSDGNVAGRSIPVQTVKWTAGDFAAVEEGQLPMGQPITEWAYGDVDGGFEEAAVVIDESFVTASLSHHCMEPRSCMAYWENGKCVLYGSSQSQTAMVPGLCQLLGVEQEDLVYVAETCGGGFGSKGGPYPIMAVPPLLSQQTGRPVMLRITRAEEYGLGIARAGFQGRLRMGLREDGRILAVDLSIVHENGPHTGWNDNDSAADSVSILYQPLAMRYRGIPVQTNTPPRGPQRGPGQNQIAEAVEPILDKAARELGIDQLSIRRINSAGNDARIGGRQGPVTSAYQDETLVMGAELFNWEEKQARSGQRTGRRSSASGSASATTPPAATATTAWCGSRPTAYCTSTPAAATSARTPTPPPPGSRRRYSSMTGTTASSNGATVAGICPGRRPRPAATPPSPVRAPTTWRPWMPCTNSGKSPPWTWAARRRTTISAMKPCSPRMILPGR